MHEVIQVQARWRLVTSISLALLLLKLMQGQALA